MYQREQKLSFFPKIMLNVDSSFIIQDSLPKFSEVIIDTLMEGTVSQNFYLVSSSCFMQLQKLCLKILEKFPIF